jgi:KaiC/GvpD/RAD55 family RecA-like ATPase
MNSGDHLAATYLDDDDFDVVVSHQLADGKLFIGAREIRKQATGVHAHIEVRYNSVPLGFDTFNVGRIRERRGLSGYCHTRLPEPRKTDVAKETLESYVDEFCRRVYANSLKNLAPAPLDGDPDIPITMICGDYIVEGGGTIMFAPPGKGKSYTAMAMALSVDAGNHKIWGVKKSSVLYVNLERSKESIQRRIGQCNVALGEHKNRPLHALNTRGKSLEAVKDVIRRYIQQEGIEVLFLDSISRSGQGSLSSDEDTNRTIDLLNNLSPTWLAIGHTPRGDSTHVFGSVHFEAGADLMVSLTSQIDGDLMGVGLKVEKSNDTPKPPRGRLALEFDPYGLARIRKAEAGEFAEIDSQTKPLTKDLLVEYLIEHGQISATQAVEELGINRGEASHILSGDSQFEHIGNAGHRKLYGLRNKDAS